MRNLLGVGAGTAIGGVAAFLVAMGGHRNCWLYGKSGKQGRCGVLRLTGGAPRTQPRPCTKRSENTLDRLELVDYRCSTSVNCDPNAIPATLQAVSMCFPIAALLKLVPIHQPLPKSIE